MLIDEQLDQKNNFDALVDCTPEQRLGQFDVKIKNIAVIIKSQTTFTQDGHEIKMSTIPAKQFVSDVRKDRFELLLEVSDFDLSFRRRYFDKDMIISIGNVRAIDRTAHIE